MAQTGVTKRLVGNITALEDTGTSEIRVDRFGSPLVNTLGDGRQGLADEGSYFIATNPTPDTGIALTTSITAFAETAGAVSGALHHKNGETTEVAGSKRIYPDYIKLICASVHTTGSSIRYAITLNDNASSYTSGGSAITPVCVNTEIANTATISTLYFGALTTAVPTNRRLISKGTIKPRIDLVLDEFVLAFGASPSGGYAPADAAAIMRLIQPCPPICISAGWSMILHIWAPSCNAAAQYEFEYGWYEK